MRGQERQVVDGRSATVLPLCVADAAEDVVDARLADLGRPSPTVALACGSMPPERRVAASAMQAATLTAVVVLPTPPF